jgi:hypothetical protein
VLAALREVEAGDSKQALADAHAAMRLGPNRDVRSMAALAMALGGETAEADRLAIELNKDFPLDTVVLRYWLPATHAAIALARREASKVVEDLAAASALDLSEPATVTVFLVPPYLRGRAYLMLRDGKAARAEFQKLIDHYGLIGNFPWGALSRLGVPRADAMSGDEAEARSAYRQFLGIWRDADPDIPIFRQAKAEYARLQIAKRPPGDRR